MVAFNIGYTVKPQAPTGFAVDKFLGADKGTDVLLRQWFGGNQGFFLIGGKDKVAAVGRLVAFTHFIFPTDLGSALGNNQIGRINQIRIDVGYDVFFGFAFDVGIVIEVFGQGGIF